ncbi:MAG: carbohydrate ABC transporter permease [Lachnospiraceae bacterium]|nr:carbohydrate ABC transporter permease [Lachnospiraceae bacterium]
MQNEATVSKLNMTPLKESRKTTRNKWIRFFVLVVASVAMLYPLIWMVSSSFKPEETIFQNMGLIPYGFTFENYVVGWASNSVVTFTTYFFNSIKISTLSVIGNLIACSLTAYAFARLNFKFKGLFFSLMMLTMMVPQHATIVPQFIYFTRFGLNNTIIPLVLPRFLAVEGFFIFLIMQFIRGLPRELDEAATIDGCSKYAVFFRVLLPLCKPALITTVIFTFIWSWNDFFTQIIYLREAPMWTVTLGLRLFIDATARSAFGPMFAMSTLSLVPIIILFIFFQKYLVEGVATTGLKG